MDGHLRHATSSIESSCFEHSRSAAKQDLAGILLDFLSKLG
jgi:hypothetical protein